MTQSPSSSTTPAPGSMIGNFFKKAQFWRSPENPTMTTKWVEQALPARYLDDETLENDLDRILGKDGWKTSKVVQGRRILSVRRLLNDTELSEIQENAKNHYAQSREASQVMD